MYYQKRQNLQYWLLEKAIGSRADYQAVTEKSVRLTIERLAAFGDSFEEIAVPVDIAQIDGVVQALRKGLPPPRC